MPEFKLTYKSYTILLFLLLQNLTRNQNATLTTSDKVILNSNSDIR